LNQSIKSPGTDYDRELANLTKLYSDDAKYSEENDNFSFKLIIFHDMCARVDVSHSVKMKTFLIMLKDLALDFYYSNMSISTLNRDILITFDEVCYSMSNYFESAEYKRSILTRWNNLTLKSVIRSNQNKSMKECLQLLIQDLRHLQHELDSALRTEQFILNKLITACQDVSAC
jgi:hypothetical protein